MQKNEIAILAYTQRAGELADRIRKRLETDTLPENVTIPESSTCGGFRCRVYLHRSHAAGDAMQAEEFDVTARDYEVQEDTDTVVTYFVVQDAQVSGVSIFDKTEDVLDEIWQHADMILYIAAAGITVRTIAPYIRDKMTDPAVLCMDENAAFVIPLLSGHIGGANAWAKRISGITGATAVVTTATDGRELFAIDLFAKENGFVITDRDMIKAISGAVLAGESVGWFCDESIEANICPELPEGLTQCKGKNSKDRPRIGITLTEDETLGRQFETECRLYPKNLCLGIGCKKDILPGALSEFVKKVLDDAGLSRERIFCVTSIDRKKDETAIIALAKEMKIPFLCFTAEQLADTEGDFASSDFVESRVGVDNVCERSAVKGAGEGAQLVVKKAASDGMTVAVGKRPYTV